MAILMKGAFLNTPPLARTEPTQTQQNVTKNINNVIKTSRNVMKNIKKFYEKHQQML